MVPLNMMKRAREVDFDNITTMANCLMLLSHGNEYETINIDSPSRVFECKTCNRQFSSFQALGGHRASYKKPKVSAELSLRALVPPPPPPKPKTHECSICGLEFSIGQALGGHMRRHRMAPNEDHKLMPLSLSPPTVVNVPVVKKSNSRRVMCLDLDLNLTPSENGLDFSTNRKVAPHRLDCYF